METSDGSSPLEGRQETFCALLLPGTMTPTEAYRQAGFSHKNAKNNSSRLRAKECIKARIAFLRAELANKEGITKEGQSRKVDRALRLAEEQENATAMVAAIKCQNLLYGLEKQVIETTSDEPMTRSEQEEADDWAEFKLWKAGRSGPRVVGIQGGA